MDVHGTCKETSECLTGLVCDKESNECSKYTHTHTHTHTHTITYTHIHKCAYTRTQTLKHRNTHTKIAPLTKSVYLKEGQHFRQGVSTLFKIK